MVTHKVTGEEAKQMLHKNATNVSQHLLEQLQQELPPAAKKVAERRVWLAGHCIQHPELTASSLVLWQPTKGKTSRGRPAITYIDNPRRHTGLEEVTETRVQCRTGYSGVSKSDKVSKVYIMTHIKHC